jgi:hypothetical protein
MISRLLLPVHGVLKKFVEIETTCAFCRSCVCCMKAVPFFKNLGRLLFLNGLVKPLWIFGVDRQMQNLVGFEAYGTYFSLFNLRMFFPL